MWVGLSKRKSKVRVLRMSKGVTSSTVQALASTWWSSNITTISGNTISVATCRGVFQTGPVGKFTSVTSYNITRRHLLGVGGGTLRSSMASYWESSLSCQRATTKSFADLSQRSVVLWCGV